KTSFSNRMIPRSQVHILLGPPYFRKPGFFLGRFWAFFFNSFSRRQNVASPPQAFIRRESQTTKARPEDHFSSKYLWTSALQTTSLQAGSKVSAGEKPASLAGRTRRLLDIETLRRLTKSIAMLDA